jgi:outer membrane lipoprotein-sorting protein
MQSRLLIRTGGIVALVVAGVIPSLACVASAFTAEIVSKEGKKVSTSNIYVSDNKTRREFTLDGKKRVTIVRADKNLTWHLKPTEKTYVEMKGARLRTPDPADLKKFAEEQMAGREKIAGYMCKKFVYTPREEGGTRITIWISEKLNWPLKTQVSHTGGGITSEYRNIKETKPKDVLFELPYDYKLVKPEEPKTVPPKSAQPKGEAPK